MIKRVNVLGVGLSVLNLQSALAEIADAIRARRKGYICVTGVHGVMEAQESEAFRTILNRSYLCTPDGMPMVWIGRIHGHTEMRRVYGPDLMLEVCVWGEKIGCRHFFYGGADGVAQLLAEKLKARFPKMEVVGTYTPPFRLLNAEEEMQLIEMVRAAKPDIIWVGLSTPKQERFAAEYLSKLDVTLIIAVGAAFDFPVATGRNGRRFHPWMQRTGLEWFYRLCQEPRRLAKRYFRNNPLFVLKIIGQLTGLKKYSLD